MTKNNRKPQKQKTKQKKHKGLIALEREMKDSFEIILQNSFDVNDENLIHAIGRLCTVRNLFAKAHEDNVRYIPVIKVELVKV